MTASRPLRRAARIGVLALSAFLLCGCSIEVDVSGTVAASNTMDSTITMAVSNDIASTIGWDEQACESAMSTTPPPSGTSTMQPYSGNGTTGCSIVVQGMSIDDASYLLDTVMQTGDTESASSGSYGAGGGGDANLSIQRDGEHFVVSGSLNMGPYAAMMAMFMHFKLSLTFPGRVVSSNGDASGNTVTWTLGSANGDTFSATAEVYTSPWRTIAWIAGGVILAGAIAMGIVLLVRRHKRAVAARIAQSGYIPPAYPGQVPYPGPIVYPGSPAYEGFAAYPGAPAQPTVPVPPPYPTGSMPGLPTEEPVLDVSPGAGLGNGLSQPVVPEPVVPEPVPPEPVAPEPAPVMPVAPAPVPPAQGPVPPPPLGSMPPSAPAPTWPPAPPVTPPVTPPQSDPDIFWRPTGA